MLNADPGMPLGLASGCTERPPGRAIPGCQASLSPALRGQEKPVDTRPAYRRNFADVATILGFNIGSGLCLGLLGRDKWKFHKLDIGDERRRRRQLEQWNGR